MTETSKKIPDHLYAPPAEWGDFCGGLLTEKEVGEYIAWAAAQDKEWQLTLNECEMRELVRPLGAGLALYSGESHDDRNIFCDNSGQWRNFVYVVAMEAADFKVVQQYDCETCWHDLEE